MAYLEFYGLLEGENGDWLVRLTKSSLVGQVDLAGYVRLHPDRA